MRIEVLPDGMTRPYRHAQRVTSPAGSFRFIVEMNAAETELTAAIVDADPGVTATITYGRDRGALPLHDPARDPESGTADGVPDDDDLRTGDIPAGDAHALRVALAAARRRLEQYDNGAQAWVLTAGHGDHDDDNNPYPVLVVVGNRGEAETERNRRNLEHLAEHGRIDADDTVHLDEGVSILWGE